MPKREQLKFRSMEVQHKFPASAVAGEERQKAKPIAAIKMEPFPKQEQLKLRSMEVEQKFNFQHQLRKGKNLNQLSPRLIVFHKSLNKVIYWERENKIRQ